MNLPNLITLTRIAMIPLFMLFMLIDTDWSRNLALAIFVLASVTDGIDGFIARKYNLVTNFGKFIDPLADKLLVTAALLIFVQQGLMNSVSAMLIIAREFMVTSLRVVAISEGVVIAADFWGKVKTFTQIVCIVIILLPKYGFQLYHIGAFEINSIAVWVMVIVTLWSGVEYIYRHRKLILPK